MRHGISFALFMFFLGAVSGQKDSGRIFPLLNANVCLIYGRETDIRFLIIQIPLDVAFASVFLNRIQGYPRAGMCISN